MWRIPFRFNHSALVFSFGSGTLKRTILGADKSNVGQFNKSADQGRRNLAWQMPLDCHFEFGHFGTIGLLKLILFQPLIVRTCGPIQTAGGRFRQLMDSL
jgi:hypothetical protein